MTRDEPARFLESTLRTTLGVSSVMLLWLLQSMDRALVGGFVAGVFLSVLLVTMLRTLTGRIVDGERRSGLRVLVALSAKLGLLYGYLTLVLETCNLSPVAFAVGFGVLYAVMTLKAALAVNREALNDRFRGARYRRVLDPWS